MLRLVCLASGSRVPIGCEGFNSETSPRSAGGTVGGTDEPHSAPAVKRMFRRTLLQRHDRRWSRRKAGSATSWERVAVVPPSAFANSASSSEANNLLLCEEHLDKSKFRVEVCAQIAVKDLRLLDSSVSVHCTPEQSGLVITKARP